MREPTSIFRMQIQFWYCLNRLAQFASYPTHSTLHIHRATKTQNFIIFYFFISFPLFGYSYCILFSVGVLFVESLLNRSFLQFHDRISSPLSVSFFKRIGKRRFSPFGVLFFLRKNIKVGNMAARWVYCFLPIVLLLGTSPYIPSCHSSNRDHRRILFTWCQPLCVWRTFFRATIFFFQFQLLKTLRIVHEMLKCLLNFEKSPTVWIRKKISPLFNDNYSVLASKMVRNENVEKNNTMLIANQHQKGKKSLLIVKQKITNKRKGHGLIYDG